jgi:bifunctional lysine-specific demethylase and histidyl-hydroxylase NO66
VPREAPGRFDDLLSQVDVERLVCSGGLRFPAFRLVKANAKLAPHEYTNDVSWRPTPFSGAADVGRISSEFAAGATIVLQALHLNHLPLALFCRELEARLGQPVQANAYYTPREAQGLPVHHDTHDVLVLQVAGEKRWLVYDPVLELPLKDQRYSPELGAPGETVLDLTLRAGDTLYLPRGWLHEALTSGHDSLHLTIGINTYTARDALAAATAAAEDELELRRGVGAEGELAEDLLERVAERLDTEAVAARMRERFVSSRRPILDGQLEQLRKLDSLSTETPLGRRRSVIADLRGHGDALVLVFEGKRLTFPSRVLDGLSFVVETGATFTAADLPGSLDAEGRLVLVRRLIREGFLRASY